jgi:H+/gluconate symporter-like permease
MSIALEALGPTVVGMANAAGVSLEAMHRVTALASGTLDVLPHSGAVITLLAVCKLSHRESYGDVFVVCCIAPTLSLVVVLVVASLFGSF